MAEPRQRRDHAPALQGQSVAGSRVVLSTGDPEIFHLLDYDYDYAHEHEHDKEETKCAKNG